MLGLRKAFKFADNLVKLRNLTYGEDKQPYTVHLIDVLDVAIEYIHYIPQDDRHFVIQAVMLHDSIEDGGISYNDVAKEFGEVVADIVDAVSSGRGKNRRERMESTFPLIRENKLALFVKLCDRIANTSYSLIHNEGMFNMYKKEYEYFRENLLNDKTTPHFVDMWLKLNKLYEIQIGYNLRKAD